MNTMSFVSDLFTSVVTDLQLNTVALRVVENKSYISVLFYDHLICTVRESTRSVYFTFPADSEPLFDPALVSKIKSDPDHIKVSASAVSDLAGMREQLASIIGSVRTSSSFDICSHYLECSDARRCVQTAPYAVECSYRKKLEKGIIFFGDNRNVGGSAPTPSAPSAPRDPMKSTRALSGFPESYIVIDTETTGLDASVDSVIEVSALRCVCGEITDSFSSLVRPPLRGDGTYVDDFISSLTGITNDMLRDAPDPADVFPALRSFLGDSILVGHNISFDLKFLSAAFESVCANPLTADVCDTLRLSRRLLPDLPHHRLGDVAAALGVTVDTAHRSLSDCETTQKCLSALRDLAASLPADVLEPVYKHRERECYDPTRTLTEAPVSPDPDHLLCGREVVFTGTLSVSRTAAMQMVVNVGGKPANAITRSTNYLVVGSFEYESSVKGGKSSKVLKAEKMQLDGYDIQIISERTFFDLVAGGGK